MEEEKQQNDIDPQVADHEENTEVIDTEPEVSEERRRTDPSTLPQDTVHCYPADPGLINRRRMITAILIAVSLIGGVYFALPASQNFVLLAVFAVITIVSAIVFAQTFLIAKYRVAVDYGKKEFVLRYQFQKIRIPFENFETREGKPEKSDELINLTSKGGKATLYLILDDVRASACYQTSTRDLAGIEDFRRLQKDATEIQSAYRGVLVSDDKPDSEDEMDKIIKNAMS